MNRSYSKLRHIQKTNQLLESKFLNEQIVSDVGQLVMDVVNFIWDMNIVPGPIDGAKLIYDLSTTDNAAETIKKFVRDRIPTPKENWKKIEMSMDKLGGSLGDFKTKLYTELKKKLG
jgi:hypothetical protein